MRMSCEVEDLLVCPKTDLPVRLVDGGYVSTGDPDIPSFPV